MCELDSIINRLALWNRTSIQHRTQCFSIQQLGNQKSAAVVFADVERSENVGMIERCYGPRLLLEAVQPIAIARERFGEDLYRNFAAKTSVQSAIDFAHAARAQRRLNFVGTQLRARGERHPWLWIISRPLLNAMALLVRNEIPQSADSRDCHLDHIAGDYRPDATRSPGCDQITWEQSHCLRDMANNNVQRKNEVTCVTLLPNVSVHSGFDSNARPGIELIAD